MTLDSAFLQTESFAYAAGAKPDETHDCMSTAFCRRESRILRLFSFLQTKNR
ncbi:hypothetical protein HMPREF3213_03358 [Heyndrickxia coagulans]|uniref:Uncharacterized protein n=1 Tax=Heyndrickxia coagulans TaxID=1398 RepID=A0A133KCB7_HEYCO|nr:hypothetical protein HMPREF3213_03358 [Heyndrickxia coagulans]